MFARFADAGQGDDEDDEQPLLLRDTDATPEDEEHAARVARYRDLFLRRGYVFERPSRSERERGLAWLAASHGELVLAAGA